MSILAAVTWRHFFISEPRLRPAFFGRESKRVSLPLRDIRSFVAKSALVGMVFDFAHATMEGANAWEMNFNLAQPHIGAVYFKDYKLNEKKCKACPIGERVVNHLAETSERYSDLDSYRIR